MTATVSWPLQGLVGKVLDPVVERQVEAGSTIPLKWSISGPGVNAGTVTSVRFLTDGANYKMVKSGPHWHLNVQTPKTWAATSRVFRITLVDGSTYEAEFTLK
ncbi:hypothetical protein [Actinoplanes sp. NPDC049599]|uniref:hypothetical protein n=1 Tax=Actinoplanes sp. NPDC049599 TaxID=3363903 RepID=UPI0037ADCB47